MITVDGNVIDLERKLDAMGSAAGDLTDVWPEVGRWWQARERAVFATMNRGAWPMRDPDTRMSRGVLIRTGELLRAVSNPKPLYASATTARFGASGAKGWYGVFHQRGKGVPLRQPVPAPTATEANEVAEIIGQHIMGAS